MRPAACRRLTSFCYFAVSIVAIAPDEMCIAGLCKGQKLRTSCLVHMIQMRASVLSSSRNQSSLVAHAIAVSWNFKSSAVQDVGFFIGLPLLLCACMTIAGPYAAQIGYAGALAYVAMLSFVPWWIAGLTTHVVGRCWGHRLPLWLVAALGALAAGPLVLFYACGVYWVAEAWWPSLPSSGRLVMSLERWQAFALSEGRSIVLWVAFVIIFAESFGWRRYVTANAAVVIPANRFQASGAQWTDEDDYQLRHLIAEGLPPRVIASRMQRTFHAVRARTTKLGLKNNKP